MQFKDQGPRIISSTYTATNSSGENVIDEHLFSFQISGSLIINDGKESKAFEAGEFRLSIRNKLAKFTKQVSADGEYRSISVAFGQALLREFAMEYNYKAHPRLIQEPVLLLGQDTHYRDYFASLTPFLQPDHALDETIVKLKIKEALLTLLKLQPDLKDILF